MLTVCIFGCAATKKLSITADDQIVELYANGVPASFEAGSWEKVRKVDIPADTDVIAVKAIDVAKVSVALYNFLKPARAAVL